MDKKRLLQLSHLFKQEIEKKELVDASIMVLHHDQEEFFETYGNVARDTIFKIYSMTKPVTAAAVMILFERGIIDLKDPISKYLECFEHMMVMGSDGKEYPSNVQITIKNCLDMTSGLVYQGNESICERIMEEEIRKLKEKNDKQGFLTNEEVAKAISKVPLLFEPGECWHYGMSADVLGMVIAKVTGMKLSEFMEKEIFKPLGMKDTAFIVSEEKKNRLATMYMKDPTDGKVVKASEQKLKSILQREIIEGSSFEAGGSGLYSTIDDYAQFAQMLLHNGKLNGKQILGRKTVEYMRSNQLTKEQSAGIYFEHAFGYGYGNLMRILIDKSVACSNGTLQEYGWDGLPGTYFCVDPKEQLIILYMQQICDGQEPAVRRKMRQIIYGAIDD
ncbi:MAG: serine hydrolase [Lachnospiraceae bacterium]|nr:serine hydrolase [Lachnospiraceae bacterium]